MCVWSCLENLYKHLRVQSMLLLLFHMLVKVIVDAFPCSLEVLEVVEALIYFLGSLPKNYSFTRHIFMFSLVSK